MDTINLFLELVKAQGIGLACLIIVTWAWLTRRVLSRAEHEAIIALYKQSNTDLAVDRDFWRDTFGPTAEIANRAITAKTTGVQR